MLKKVTMLVIVILFQFLSLSLLFCGICMVESVFWELNRALTGSFIKMLLMKFFVN